MGMKYGSAYIEADRVWEYGADDNIGPRRDEVTREWRKIYNEELNDLYFSIGNS
jgi:hypothetical protein